MIGFGTGTTAGASLLFDGTRVDCCEIEPAVIEAASHFDGLNYAPTASPNYRTPARGRSRVPGAAPSASTT